MKLWELIKQIEAIVPPGWALPKDPIGLHIGDTKQPIQRVFVALEATRELVEKAAKQKCDLMFVHHPLLFHPLASILEGDAVGRIARRLIQNDIALYAAHTNFDLHPEGMAKRWLSKMGCTNIHPAMPKPKGQELKLVTYSPPSHTAEIRTALSAAGAGVIGEYDQCSYTSAGYGTFRGSEATNPYTGQAGMFEQVDEERVEMVLPPSRKAAVVEALFAAHPYEEPAYDIYPLETVIDLRQALWIGEFAPEKTWPEFEETIHQSLPIPPSLNGVRPRPDGKVGRIAVSTGSGSSMIQAASRLGVDAYLTGEAGYHNLWEAHEQGLNLVLAGHGVSESFFAETAIDLLKPRISDIEWVSEYAT